MGTLVPRSRHFSKTSTVTVETVSPAFPARATWLKPGVTGRPRCEVRESLPINTGLQTGVTRSRGNQKPLQRLPRRPRSTRAFSERWLKALSNSALIRLQSSWNGHGWSPPHSGNPSAHASLNSGPSTISTICRMVISSGSRAKAKPPLRPMADRRRPCWANFCSVLPRKAAGTPVRRASSATLQKERFGWRAISSSAWMAYSHARLNRTDIGANIRRRGTQGKK